MEQFGTLGDAHAKAEKNAKRDNCRWIIWKTEYGIYPYKIGDEFTSKQYTTDKAVQSVVPSTALVPVVKDRHTLTLNDEELELVKSIFKDKFDPAREFYPGSEESKDSLFKKVCKALKLS